MPKKVLPQGLNFVKMNGVKECVMAKQKKQNPNDAFVNPIDKTKVACYGGSAGGGASIYLAFHPDMADLTNADPILRQSTRIKSAGHLTSQCTYDPITMLSFFDSVGIDILSIPGIETSLMADYGISSFNQFYTDSSIVSLRNELNMLGWMTPDDPEFFTSNNNPNITPTERSEAIHHPLHAKILDSKANTIGLTHVANIPSFGIYAPNNETISEFMIRKLSE